ncbi:MAG: phosphoglycerate kinase [Patescibacteria group bacterium]|nr:phosphoglycerate kinase [Patescibacteria group bacterium]
MRSLKDVDLKGKKVVVRVGFDLPVENGVIIDDTRLRASLPTLDYILKQDPEAVVLINHFGRPDGRRVEDLSNKIIAKKLKEVSGTDVVMINNLQELKRLISSKHTSGAFFLLENIRFWYQEEANEEKFANSIGTLFDVYINDAFSVSHRAHASFVGIPKFTSEKCMGLLFEKEFTNLSRVKDDPRHPAVMAIGGAKIATKLPVIENMIKIYDHILVGGLIANEIIDEKISLGEKVILPVDYSPNAKAKLRIDIGPKTVENFIKYIKEAETIIWNGPMGKYEIEESAMGTKKIQEAITENKEAIQVVGGGETLDAIKQFGSFDDFDYVSMSGGAMLKFLAGKELPGITALE